ncbi:bifunctional alpha,alpha-trehalose-phosphate synthase (UDP-forming)/trehalose-phosphatase [Pedobacter sp. MR22-3]|uniref:bifunctional alpha,alpha-trehalose-phosphate synthase (UDP-forming)/trehalose-phosphatase n=1 Tax=Pedobacter sp. MR22-3 TaxID=2994552 RepID=UPI002246C001|nr:bifunctional alpha,alpha-trehalose-phosphate synthase (UDP-forming)/trehalose-phosphatase [Pedobacter sp. MR22-3]MCX2583848.1 bifunctional alpha,alpha-trehalose-phosphate synthase (UDP-forming)/trehalose-phosphatase [Pedobacter sp. MR22-3]
MKTVIISNRLPVKIIEENNEYTFIPSEGGLATGLGDVYKTGNSIWIGWPGIEVPEERQQEVIDKLAVLNLYPVFLTQEEINLYYEGFSNEVLWPVFHYLVTYAHYEQSYWDCYKSVNHKFAKAASNVLSAKDKIWIQDYQLLLLSGILRDQLPQSTIGFFQHIPFPSYEIFRLIPWRDELLNGMLGADLIGFHTYDDVRHFLSTATRLLPVNSTANVLNNNERQIVVEAFPMGIDFDKFSNLTSHDEVQKEIEYFRNGKEDMKVILSIDRLDYSKGILERLKALELLLQAHPEFIGKIELYMIVVPSRDTVPQYRDLKEQIDQFVGNLNARYRSINWIPVNYFYRSFPIEILSALYATADICLVTPMRDGMNLVSKEYVASRNHNNGVLILSEMAGASKELTDAVIVNPNNIGDIMEAIVLALKMPIEEQQIRMKAMRNIVEKFNVKHWVNNFILRLDEVKDSQNSLLTKHAVTAIKEVISEKYDHTTNRVLFLDYDGTLVDFAGNIDDASPDEELYNLITRLTADPANTVVIISGRRNETLEKWFGHLKVDLIAEHGAWQKAYGDKWNCLPLLTDQWKQEMKSILETYTDRTPGSFIEEKSYSLVWHYRKAEEGLGDLRANEIVSHLKILAADKGLQLMPGNKVIEFKNMEVNKGKAALNWLYGKQPDFILALGDDHTDEDIFKALPNDAFTIKVGNNISEAKYYLNDFKEVRKLLWGLLKDEVIEIQPSL